VANKAFYIWLTCCVGGLAAFSGWQVGEAFFLHSQSSAPMRSAAAEIGTFPKPNRDSKRDKDAIISATAVAEPVSAPVEPETAAPDVPPAKLADFHNARAELSSPAPRPKPSPKAEKLLPPLLDDMQIAGIKQRLDLTEIQQRYWPPVEKALRGLTEQVLNYQKRIRKSRDDSFDTESAEIKQLKSAARPFLAQLRDDQRSDVLMLANMAGLGPVVSELASGREVAKN
jgi:hypothetical protein